MGLFSSKTDVYVSSSAWNLAGPFADRPDLLASIILSATLLNTKASLTDQIQGNLRSSTAMRSRSFHNWAQNHYLFGMPTGSLGEALTVSGSNLAPTLKSMLGIPAAQKLRLLSARIDDPDVEYWAEDWVRHNLPALDDEEWTADYDPATQEIVLSINAGGTPSTTRFPAPAHFLWGIAETGRKILFAAYQVLTQRPNKTWAETEVRLFTYQMGSGNAVLDGLLTASQPMPEFVPAIPLRLYNRSILEDTEVRQDAVREGFRYLTGARLEEVLDPIEEHENVDDMDHVLLVPGVSLNSRENAAKAYLYAFFKGLMSQQVDWKAFLEQQVDGAKKEVEWDRWGSTNVRDVPAIRLPLWDKPTPTENIPARIKPKISEIQVKMEELPEYDFRVRWYNIDESQYVGNCRRHTGGTAPLARIGDYWIETLEPLTLADNRPDREPTAIDRVFDRRETMSRIAIYHQHAPMRYRRLEIHGLEHRNYVYKNKAVTITAEEALEEDEESGFLVPLHMPTLMKLNMVDRARLSGCSAYIVVNAYKKVKRKWWQLGIFKILMFAVSIAISIVSAGAGLGATAGLLGTNAAVGTMLGASAAMAALVGAVANGIAAVVVSSLISKASVAVFGEKWGAIIGTLASFVAMQVGSQFAMTGNFNVNWGALFRADNLMKLTDTMSGAYSRFMAADTAEIYADMESMAEKYEDQFEEIRKQSEEILGVEGAAFNPMMLTEASEHFEESSESFLQRTLLTGSEIVDLSHALIGGFVELTLELPNTA